MAIHAGRTFLFYVTRGVTDLAIVTTNLESSDPGIFNMLSL